MGACPFHDHDSPSLVVTPAKNLWHCLGACARGASHTAGGKTITYAYDTDGNRFVRRDPTTTLYLGDTELVLTRSTSAVTATRHYTALGRTVAVRTGTTNTNLSFVYTDLNNSGTWQIRANDSGILIRRYTLFGTLRTSTPAAWKGKQGFVGGTIDPEAGFTHLGARGYDTFAGRFTTLDPILDVTNPLQWNPYAYGYWDPTGNPDPTGLMPNRACVDECGGVDDRQAHGLVVPKALTSKKSRPKVTIENRRDTFSEGVEDGSSDKFRATIDAVNPVQMAKSVKHALANPWRTFKSMGRAVLREVLNPLSEYTLRMAALVRALTSNNQYRAGYLVGELAVMLGEEVVLQIIGSGALKIAGKATQVISKARSAATHHGPSAVPGAIPAAKAGPVIGPARNTGMVLASFRRLGAGKQRTVRTAGSVDEMRAVFEAWTVGAERLPARGPDIPDVYQLPDGATIQWRIGSASGGPTIDLRVPGDRLRKVHLADGAPS